MNEAEPRGEGFMPRAGARNRPVQLNVAEDARCQDQGTAFPADCVRNVYAIAGGYVLNRRRVHNDVIMPHVMP
jgi:hypothetical protein